MNDGKTMTVTVYGPDGEACVFSIPKKELRIGDAIEVDFDSPDTEWHDGTWGPMTGEFSFPVFGFEHGDPARPYAQVVDPEILHPTIEHDASSEEDDEAARVAEEFFEEQSRRREEEAARRALAERNLPLFPPEQLPLL